MQLWNTNLLTRSLNFRCQLDVKLQFLQNSKKIRKIRANFYCFLSSYSDENIATTRSFTLILIKQQNRSIQTIFSRRWCANRWCVQNNIIWSSWSLILFKDRAHFSKVKSIDWTLAPEQLVNCPWTVRSSSRAGLLLWNARGRPWAGHGHIDPTCSGSARRALNRSGLLGMDVPEFTMLKRNVSFFSRIVRRDNATNAVFNKISKNIKINRNSKKRQCNRQRRRKQFHWR